ncbi:TolC family outer membrane protein [Ideonella paludis]|nr:TolC family outer membrane protein [Ideonella paludis]
MHTEDLSMTPSRHFPHPAPRRALSVAIAMGLLGLSAGASAQSLSELYEAARNYDATYLGARAQAESAVYRAEQAKALNRPAASLTATANVVKADAQSTTTTTNPQGTTVSSTDTDVGTRETKVALQAQQSLYNPANAATIAQAERALAVSQAQLKAAEQDLIVRLSQAYFDVLAAKDVLSTVQASKKAISEQLASAKRNFEVGTATITDTREAQAKFDLATAQELAADNDLRVKLLALEQQVGKTGVNPRPLAAPVVLPPLQPSLVDEWLSRAEDNSTAVAQSRLSLDVAKLETEKARAGHLPTLSLGASYSRTYPGGSTDSTTNGTVFSNSRAGNSGSAAIGLTLNVPLFSGHSVQNRIKETLSLEDKARNDLEGARRAIAQGTRSAFYGVQSGQAQVKALEAAESSSKLALEATQLGYKVGVRVNLDVLNAQTQLYQTQRDLARARYDVVMGSLKLRQVTGTLTAGDVEAINALLAR